MIQAHFTNAEETAVSVSLEAGDVLGNMIGPATFSVGMCPGNAEHDALMGLVEAEAVSIGFYQPPTEPFPESPTLGDWRVGLVLWRRPEGTTNRLQDVMAAVNALVAKGNPLGVVAQERLEYSNNVFRKELLQLRSVFGFSVEEVDESLLRARQVSRGDLSGVWPLPA